MKTAGVREFKAKLSEYLREVQRGEVLLVTDRGRVVAEVRSPKTAGLTTDSFEVRLQRAIESGFVRPAMVPPEDLRAHIRQLARRRPKVALPQNAAQEIFDDLREDKRP